MNDYLEGIDRVKRIRNAKDDMDRESLGAFGLFWDEEVINSKYSKHLLLSSLIYVLYSLSIILVHYYKGIHCGMPL
jgi:hypothetical protein